MIPVSIMKERCERPLRLAESFSRQKRTFFASLLSVPRSFLRQIAKIFGSRVSGDATHSGSKQMERARKRESRRSEKHTKRRLVGSTRLAIIGKERGVREIE